MRVGVDRTKYAIQIPLPPRIDPTVTMMTVEEKPDVTYDDVGGAGDALEKLREVVELPLLHPERFVTLGIDPPKVRASLPAALTHRCLLHRDRVRACLPAYRASSSTGRPAQARRSLHARSRTAQTPASFVSSGQSSSRCGPAPQLFCPCHCPLHAPPCLPAACPCRSTRARAHAWSASSSR